MSDVKITVFQAFDMGKSYFDSGKSIDESSKLYTDTGLIKAFREGWRFQERQKNPASHLLRVEPSFTDIVEVSTHGRARR